jgi:transcriptional regulator with PAS, ATPase and Fis domain
LATHFLDHFNRKYRKQLTGFDDDALQRLLRHPWPGNVRELSHAVERSVLMATGNALSTGDLLGLEQKESQAPQVEELSLEDAERLLIEKALERHEGSVSEAAKALGLSRSALYRRLEKHSL